MASEATQAAAATRLSAIDEEAQDAQMQVELGLATNAQLIEQERQFEHRRNEIRREALNLRLAEVDPERDPEAFQKINLQIEELEAQHQHKLSELRRKGTVEDTKNFRGVMTTIQQGFAQTFAQVMRGQMTLSQAVKSMFQTVVSAVISMLAEMAAKWVATKIMEMVWGKTAAVSNVTAHAAEAGAAGVASWAAAPWPINLGAPAFGAAMFTAAGAFGAAAAAPGNAVGAWDIPDTGITKVHKGETILNATDAENFRQVRENGGNGGGGSHTVNITALDARSVRDYLKSNSSSLVPALRQLHKNFTPVK
jgi:hypothetical protein